MREPWPQTARVWRWSWNLNSLNGSVPDPGSQTHIFENLVTLFWIRSSIILSKLANFFLQHFKNKIIYNFVKFVATKKVWQQIFFPPFSFVVVFGSGIWGRRWVKSGSGIQDKLYTCCLDSVDGQMLQTGAWQLRTCLFHIYMWQIDGVLKKERNYLPNNLLISNQHGFIGVKSCTKNQPEFMEMATTL